MVRVRLLHRAVHATPTSCEVFRSMRRNRARVVASSVSGSTVSHVSKNKPAVVVPVPDRVLDDLAEVLLDRLDQLLDRLTDRALNAPTPGSRVWESEWNDRNSAIGRARAFERSRVRAELVRRAGAGLGIVDAAPPPSRQTQVARPPSRVRAGRVRVDEAQLSFF
jgi:hypothetical protein